jgi:hypothetical protein
MAFGFWMSFVRARLSPTLIFLCCVCVPLWSAVSQHCASAASAVLLADSSGSASGAMTDCFAVDC